MLEASDLVVLQSTKSHIMVRNEETLLIAEYRVSMLSGGNLTNLMEQVKRARFCCLFFLTYVFKVKCSLCPAILIFLLS